ncbi:MAG: HAMP domain-containing histidine kinase [Deltaproteobacteria bacterium]|nr:HAMP domain-containing histidine kinase [Deltaproteobacteria bacterium]
MKNAIFPHIPVAERTFFWLAVFLLLTNIAYYFFYVRQASTIDEQKYSTRISLNVQFQIYIDFIVLGYLVYLFGGIESPLIYLFILHNVISCLFFNKYISLVHTVLSLVIIFFVSLALLEGLLPPRHFLYPQAAAVYYDNPVTYSYHLAGISAIFIIVWFFASNITDSLKRHELKLQEQIDELVKMDREKTRVMLVTTHELKAPFSSIQSYVNVVLGGYAGDFSDKVRDILLKIKARCEILMRMITEMIQLANITSLKEHVDEISMSLVNISELLGSVARHFGDTAAAKGVNIRFAKHEFCGLKGNSEQLDILFNNILSNAVNYSFPGTEINVDIKDSEEKLLVTVEDEGIGIKKEHLEKVFLEYFRTEKAALTNKNSTGLGLTIAKQIMEIHKGRIWMESEEGKGTKVFMEFPKS